MVTTQMVDPCSIIFSSTASLSMFPPWPRVDTFRSRHDLIASCLAKHVSPDTLSVVQSFAREHLWDILGDPYRIREVSDFLRFYHGSVTEREKAQAVAMIPEWYYGPTLCDTPNSDEIIESIIRTAKLHFPDTDPSTILCWYHTSRMPTKTRFYLKGYSAVPIIHVDYLYKSRILECDCIWKKPCAHIKHIEYLMIMDPKHAAFRTPYKYRC